MSNQSTPREYSEHLFAVDSVQIKTAESAAAAAADQARLERTLAEAAAARGAAERRAESAEVAPSAFLEYLYLWVPLRVPGEWSGDDSHCGYNRRLTAVADKVVG